MVSIGGRQNLAKMGMRLGIKEAKRKLIDLCNKGDLRIAFVARLIVSLAKLIHRIVFTRRF